MTLKDLSITLSDMYFNAPPKNANIKISYLTELSKGIRLANYVILK